jgi:hypothetical protein
MARFAFACVVGTLLGASLLAQTGGTARLSGRAIDGGGTPLSGVTLTLTGNGARGTAITDANGRYELDAFVVGSVDYTLTAFLPGFETATRTRVRMVPGETKAFDDVVLRLGCVHNPLVVQRSIQAEARHADLTAHVRIESVAAAREWRGEYACVVAREVTAWVEADSAQGAPRRLRFLTATNLTLNAGDEFVLALGWDPVAERHGVSTFPVTVANGIATLDDQSVAEGLERQMGVDELLRRLR